MTKPELEFTDPQSAVGFAWRSVPGDRAGLEEMLLSDDPDTGDCTRLLRFPTGADTSEAGTLVHDFWEEVWIVDGTLHDLRLGQTFEAGMYACRPPGMAHGPWVSDTGALTFEIRYRSSTE